VFPAARDASVLIEGRVAKTPDGYQAELRMSDDKGRQLGSRSLSSNDTSCRELSETLTVVLAVMIDPDAAKRPPSTLPPAPEPKTEASKEKAQGDKNDLLMFTRLLLAISPKPYVGIGGAYERALGAAGGLRAEAVFFLESAQRKPGSDLPDDANAMVLLSYAGLAYCPLWLGYARMRLSGCAGLELGVVNAHDDGFPNPASDTSGLWASASASVRLAITLIGPLQAHLGASFLGAFGAKLYVDDAQGEPVWILPQNKSAPLGAALDLGLGARF